MPSLAERLAWLLAANLPELPPAADAPVLQAALPHCRLRRLAAGATLFAQGAASRALYGVLDGELEMRFAGVDGSVSIIELAPPPRLFGLAALAGGRPSTYEAVARRASVVLAIQRPAYELLMDGLPGFGRALMREFAQRHDGALRLLAASRLQPAAERLSMALAQLRESGRALPADDDGWCLVRTTQAELAALAGLSRQTTNEWLQRLAAQGRLQTEYGGVRLAPPRGPA